MVVASAAKLLAAEALWKGARVRPAGRVLLRSLSSTNENERTMAGMWLVKGGRSSLPLLREAIARRHALPMVLLIAADIGAGEMRPEIQAFAEDADPAVARAARDALRTLDRREGPD
jgi:hypothetical protein